MMMLTGSEDESIICALEDGSEIEITIVELEGNQARVIVCADQAVEIVVSELSRDTEMQPTKQPFQGHAGKCRC